MFFFLVLKSTFVLYNQSSETEIIPECLIVVVVVEVYFT